MAPSRLVLASRNEHKIRELGEILTGVELVALPDAVELPPETGETFAENALIKARAARAATGDAAIGDDSGIAARALDGRPGVRSARYAGPGASDEENLAKLLDELAGLADHRLAYVCVIAYADSAGGFGYDPVFVPDDTGPADERTMAELSTAEKHAISHRGRAARALAAALGIAS